MILINFPISSQCALNADITKHNLQNIYISKKKKLFFPFEWRAIKIPYLELNN